MLRSPDEVVPDNAAAMSPTGDDVSVAAAPGATTAKAPAGDGGGGGGGGGFVMPTIERFLAFLRDMRDLTAESEARLSPRIEALVRVKGQEEAMEEIMELKNAAASTVEKTLMLRHGFTEEHVELCQASFGNHEEVQQVMEEIQRIMMGDQACVVFSAAAGIHCARARASPHFLLTQASPAISFYTHNRGAAWRGCGS